MAHNVLPNIPQKLDEQSLDMKEDDCDTGEECDDTEQDGNQPNNYDINQNNIKYDSLDEVVSVNGITYDEYKGLKVKFGEQSKLGQCSYCLKFYHKDKDQMLSAEYESAGDFVCFHCIFWINYKLETRQTVDGVYGKTIVEYIVQCRDSHDKDSCTRSTAEGGCFLCDSLNNIPIEDIINGEVLSDIFGDPSKNSTKNKLEVPKPEDDISFKICI